MAWTLYYDGGCNLCHSSKLRIEQWAESRKFPLRVDVLQSPEGVAKGYGSAMVVEVDGVTLTAADAWLKLMWLAPWYLRWVHYLGRVPGVRQLLALGYAVVARFRYRWFGRRACPVSWAPEKEPESS